MLRLGESYKFHIIRKIQLPDESFNWLLRNDAGENFMFPVEHYENYGFHEGLQIVCRVDKINCSGRIFLEPQHPRYQIDELYKFSVIKVYEEEDKFGFSRTWILVKDEEGAEFSMPFYGPVIPEMGGNLSCKVVRIKKGKVFLREHPSYIPFDLREGDSYLFEVIYTEKIIEDKKYIELKGPNGFTHHLEADYYPKHNFKVGDLVDCTLLKLNYDGTFQLEPKHPLYNVGESYDFSFHSISTKTGHYGVEEQIILVKDGFGEKVIVYPHDADIRNYKQGELIPCRVDGFKKGLPILKLI